MASNWVSTVRLFTFVIIIFFSIVVTIMGADLLGWTIGAYTTPTVALIASSLTFLTITSMLIIDHFRKGSVFLYTSVEIGWLQVLSILWLVTGSYAAWEDSEVIAEGIYVYDGFYNCSRYGKTITRLCNEVKVTVVFSFVLAALLIGYTILLLVLNFRAKRRGYSAWRTSVRDGVLLYPINATESAAQVPAAQPTIVPPSNPHAPATQTTFVPPSNPHAPATQTTFVPQSYPHVPATQITIVPQSYSQARGAPTTIITPSYDPARQHSLPISVSYLSPSIPEV